VFVAYNAAWHEITNDLPCYDHYPPETGLSGVDEETLEPGSEDVIRGSCLCNSVQFHVTKPFKIAHNCYCTRCRRARGAAHASNGFTDLEGVTIIKGDSLLKTYKLPDARYFTQVFCEICGSKMPRLDCDRNRAVIPLGHWMMTQVFGQWIISMWLLSVSGMTLPMIFPDSQKAHRVSTLTKIIVV